MPLGRLEGPSGGKLSGRRASFAYHGNEGKLPNLQARQEWLFANKGGKDQLMEKLKPFMKNGPKRRATSVDSSAESSVGTTRNGMSRRSSIHASEMGDLRRKGSLGTLYSTTVIDNWQDLAGAPLLQESKIDPITQIMNALRLLIEALRHGIDDVTGEAFRLGRLLQSGLSRLEDPNSTEKIHASCQMIFEVVQKYGYSDGCFRPPLHLDVAERLQVTLEDGIRDQELQNSPLGENEENPRGLYSNGKSLTFWEGLQADIWELFLLPSAEEPESMKWNSGRMIMAVFQASVLALWAIFYAIISGPEFYRSSDEVRFLIDAFDICFAIIFAVDILLRMLVCPSIKDHFGHPIAICEVVAVFPFYVKWIHRWYGGSPDVVTGFIGQVDMLSVLRVLKATNFMGENIGKLSVVVKTSSRMLVVGGFVLLLCIVVMSSIMFFIEMSSSGYHLLEPPLIDRVVWVRKTIPPKVIITADGTKILHSEDELSPYQSMYDFFWWCITTLTTVGYGDTTPTSAGGRVAAGFCMVVGVLVLALPASVICSHFTLTRNDSVAMVQREERSDVREMVRKICSDSSRPYAHIMLHHFVMLDCLELNHQKNPSSEDLAGVIYQHILWVYKAFLYTKVAYLAAKGEETNIEVEELCIRRFVANCAEVFRHERDQLWGAYAKIMERDLKR